MADEKVKVVTLICKMKGKYPIKQTRYKLTDLRIKKSNSYVRNIYEEEGKILTHKHGYPQFYTQILFKKGKQDIFIKTVLNDEEGISKISTCKKIEKFDNES